MAPIQEEEMTSIKEEFRGRSRIVETKKGDDVIRNVTVLPNMDVKIKFVLSGSYPVNAPDIDVRATCMEEEKAVELKGMLKVKAKQYLNRPMISSLVSDADKWLITNGLGGAGKVGNGPKKKKRKKKAHIEELADETLASMKTADDVINRIQWDSDLPQEDFLIGYQDIFEGIKEKYFVAFSWEDIASVDYDELAAPKHRIEYFKYKELKVWDKLSRLDNIFGSVGSGKKITDVIENYETELQLQQEKEKDIKTDTISHVSASKSEASTEPKSESESDSDSEDGVVPTSGYWKDKLPPNYFLAIRITNPEIVKVTSGIQASIRNSQSAYNISFSAPSSLHITLCTLGLDTKEQIDSAVKALHSIHEELKVLVPRKSLKVNGVSNFNKRVVYAKVEYPPEFLEFVEHIEMCLRREGIEFRGQHGEYVPHMTIMKTTRPISRRLGTANIKPKLYQHYSEQYFGEVPVNAVYLCSMVDPRQLGGFYVSPTHITFSEASPLTCAMSSAIAISWL